MVSNLKLTIVYFLWTNCRGLLFLNHLLVIKYQRDNNSSWRNNHLCIFYILLCWKFCNYRSLVFQHMSSDLCSIGIAHRILSRYLNLLVCSSNSLPLEILSLHTFHLQSNDRVCIKSKRLEICKLHNFQFC